MKFTKKQMTAFYCLTSLMAVADGKVDVREPMLTSSLFASLGFTDIEKKQITDDAGRMTPSESIATILGMSPEEKKYIAAFLISLMAVDGEIANEEQSMLSLLTAMCGLPKFNTVRDAIDYLDAQS